MTPAQSYAVADLNRAASDLVQAYGPAALIKAFDRVGDAIGYGIERLGPNLKHFRRVRAANPWGTVERIMENRHAHMEAVTLGIVAASLGGLVVALGSHYLWSEELKAVSLPSPSWANVTPYNEAAAEARLSTAFARAVLSFLEPDQMVRQARAFRLAGTNLALPVTLETLLSNDLSFADLLFARDLTMSRLRATGLSEEETAAVLAVSICLKALRLDGTVRSRERAALGVAAMSVVALTANRTAHEGDDLDPFAHALRDNWTTYLR